MTIKIINKALEIRFEYYKNSYNFDFYNDYLNNEAIKIDSLYISVECDIFLYNNYDLNDHNLLIHLLNYLLNYFENLNENELINWIKKT